MDTRVLRHLTRNLLSRGNGSRLTILIYHRVHATADPMSPDEVDAATFDWQLRCLREYCNVLPLDLAVALWRRRQLPPGTVVVTFDDGYRDNFDVALPLLVRHGLCATFFIATGYLGSGIMFNDIVIESMRRCALPRLDLHDLGLGSYALGDMAARRAAVADILPKLKYLPWRERSELALRLASRAQVQLPNDLMLTEDQVRALHSAGMRIGAHTVHHPILASTNAEDATDEISQSKSTLESILGAKVDLFAYPNGYPGRDYGAEHVDTIRRLGFLAAVSTAPGVAAEGTDPYQLPRFLPWDKRPFRFLARLVQNSFDTDVIHV